MRRKDHRGWVGIRRRIHWDLSVGVWVSACVCRGLRRGSGKGRVAEVLESQSFQRTLRPFQSAAIGSVCWSWGHEALWMVTVWTPCPGGELDAKVPFRVRDGQMVQGSF